VLRCRCLHESAAGDLERGQGFDEKGGGSVEEVTRRVDSVPGLQNLAENAVMGADKVQQGDVAGEGVATQFVGGMEATLV